MRNELKERAENYAQSTMTYFSFYGGMVYFTRNPINNDLRYKGKKYFFCYLNTHTIAEAFKTQAELNDFLISKGF